MNQNTCKSGQSRIDSHQTFTYTLHAIKRMNARGISQQAIQAVFRYGRKVFARGALIFTIGHKEVRRFIKQGIKLDDYAGIQVVCSPEKAVLTVYRNHDFRSLRPTRRRRR